MIDRTSPRLTPAVWIATVVIASSCARTLFIGAERMIHGAGGIPVDPPPLFNPFWVGLFEVLLAAFLLGCQYLAAFRRRWPHSLLVAVLFCISGILIVCLGNSGSELEMIVGGTHLFAGIVMGRWGWRRWRG